MPWVSSSHQIDFILTEVDHTDEAVFGSIGN